MAGRLERLTDLIQHRLFVELEASARHVHVTKEHAKLLFGHGLTEVRPLSQPGQFLAAERVSVVGTKGTLENVAVLGPCRSESQVEISFTDSRILGVKPPVRMSGMLHDTPGIQLIGPNGSLKLQNGVIVAQRHIHMTPEDAALHHVKDGDIVRLKALTARPVVFEQVVVRVDRNFATYVHLDFDEANACGFEPGDLGLILH